MVKLFVEKYKEMIVFTDKNNCIVETMKFWNRVGETKRFTLPETLDSSCILRNKFGYLEFEIGGKVFVAAWK